MSTDTGMQMQTAIEDEDKDPSSEERRIHRKRLYRIVVEGGAEDPQSTRITQVCVDDTTICLTRCEEEGIA